MLPPLNMLRAPVSGGMTIQPEPDDYKVQPWRPDPLEDAALLFPNKDLARAVVHRYLSPEEGVAAAEAAAAEFVKTIRLKDFMPTTDSAVQMLRDWYERLQGAVTKWPMAPYNRAPELLEDEFFKPFLDELGTLLGHKESMLYVVKHTGTALKFASDDLRQDLDVVLAAVRNNQYAKDYAMGDLEINHLVTSAAWGLEE